MPLKTGIPVLQGGEDVKPTREQLIEQAIQGHAGTRMAMQWLFDQAHAAGRAQGLRDAREVCEANKADWLENAKGCTSGMYDFMADAADSCAAAIKQLEGK